MVQTPWLLRNQRKDMKQGVSCISQRCLWLLRGRRAVASPSPPTFNLSQHQDLLEYNKLPSGNEHHLLILTSFCRSGIQTESSRVVSFLLHDFWPSARRFEGSGLELSEGSFVPVPDGWWWLLAEPSAGMPWMWPRLMA